MNVKVRLFPSFIVRMYRFQAKLCFPGSVGAALPRDLYSRGFVSINTVSTENSSHLWNPVYSPPLVTPLRRHSTRKNEGHKTSSALYALLKVLSVSRWFTKGDNKHFRVMYWMSLLSSIAVEMCANLQTPFLERPFRKKGSFESGLWGLQFTHSCIPARRKKEYVPVFWNEWINHRSQWMKKLFLKNVTEKLKKYGPTGAVSDFFSQKDERPFLRIKKWEWETEALS
jgi:hypothetical protein